MSKPNKRHLSLCHEFNTHFDSMHSRPRSRGKFTVAKFIKDAFRRIDAIRGIYTSIEMCMVAFWLELQNIDNERHPFNVDRRSYRLYPNSYNLRIDGLQATIIILRLIATAKLNADPIHPSLLDTNYNPICIPNKDRRLSYDIIIGVERKPSCNDIALHDVNELRIAQSDDLIYCLGQAEPITYATLLTIFNNVPDAFHQSLIFSNSLLLDALQQSLQRYMLINPPEAIENEMKEKNYRANIGLFFTPKGPLEEVVLQPEVLGRKSPL